MGNQRRAIALGRDSERSEAWSSNGLQHRDTGVNGADSGESNAPMCDKGAYWTVYLEYARDVTVTGRFTCDNDKLLTLEPVVRWMVPP